MEENPTPTRWKVNESLTQYRTLAPADFSPVEQQEIVAFAIQIILDKFERWPIIDLSNVIQELQVLLANEKNEVFCMMYLDNQNRLLSFDKHFQGTINQCSVYPRVLVERALEIGASCGIIVHNHPSGCANPSRSDRAITDRIIDALKLIDFTVHDHIIVSPCETYSFVKKGDL